MEHTTCKLGNPPAGKFKVWSITFYVQWCNKEKLVQNFQPPTQANAKAINQEGKVLISTITACVEDGVMGRQNGQNSYRMQYPFENT